MVSQNEISVTYNILVPRSLSGGLFEDRLLVFLMIRLNLIVSEFFRDQLDWRLFLMYDWAPTIPQLWLE